MSETPRTEAGRALLAALQFAGAIAHDRDAILAIEAEAAASPSHGPDLDVEQSAALEALADAIYDAAIMRTESVHIQAPVARALRDALRAASPSSGPDLREALERARGFVVTDDDGTPIGFTTDPIGEFVRWRDIEHALDKDSGR